MWRRQRFDGPINLLAVDREQKQILVYRDGNGIALPALALPHPVMVSGQAVFARLSALIQEQFTVTGTVVGLCQGEKNAGSETTLLVFVADDTNTSPELDRRGYSWREISAFQNVVGAETSGRLQTALNLVVTSRTSGEFDEFWSARVTKTLEFLRVHVVRKGGLVGWSQFLGADSVGVLSTAQGILTFLESGAVNHITVDCLQTIRKLQNPDGGWPVRRALIGTSERSIGESSLYCLWALTASGSDSQDPVVLRGVEWLERAQRGDGGWGSTEVADRSRVYPTAFAVRYLAGLSPATSKIKQALAWLRGVQNPDGGWPALPDTDVSSAPASTAVHTAHAILALVAAGADRTDPHVKRAISYLRTTFNSAAGEPWPSASEVETIDADAALDFRHFSTPWVLAALLAAGLPLGDETVVGALRWLITAQHSLGYWSSSLTPGQRPVWATFDAIHTLSIVRQHAVKGLPDILAAEVRSTELDLAWRKYFCALDEWNQRMSRARRLGSRWMYAWNASLTFVVLLLLLFQLGPGVVHLSPVAKVAGSALVGLVPGFAPFAYQLALDEFRRRREKGKRTAQP